MEGLQARLAALVTAWEQAAIEMRPEGDLTFGYNNNEDAAYDAQADIYHECARELRKMLQDQA